EYSIGVHTLPDGRTLIATDRDLTFSDGTRRPNGGPMIYLTGGSGKPGIPSPNAAQEHRALGEAWGGKRGESAIESARPGLANAKVNPDDELVDDYIKFGPIKKKNGHGGKPLNATREKQARKLWETFKLVVNKPLAECSYEDGVKLVAHIEAEHLKKHGEP